MTGHRKAVAADVTEAYTDSESEHSEDDPMTDEQAVVLKRLCEQAHEPQTFDGELTKSEATKVIEEMRKKVGDPNGQGR